jgi:hypothetical protein
MMITQALTGEDSDGIVSVRSSLGIPALHTKSGRFAAINIHQDLIPLEHWEQTLDYRWFPKIGVVDINFIHEKQIEFYSNLAKEFLQR